MDGLPQLVGKHYVRDTRLFVITGVQHGITRKGFSFIDLIEVRPKVINDDGSAALGKHRWIMWSSQIQERIADYERQFQPDGELIEIDQYEQEVLREKNTNALGS